MSLAMTIFSMIAAWMAVALAMLWGVLRIARRYQPPVAVSVYRECRAPMAQGWAVSLSSN
ncbi:hypothetical protein [Pseudomonas prosekii]|uniref:hypothetical protein n=1 Tax=Pseudomonas prosekii TaxID=1148509 RepID=UPI003F753336